MTPFTNHVPVRVRGGRSPVQLPALPALAPTEPDAVHRLPENIRRAASVCHGRNVKQPAGLVTRTNDQIIWGTAA